MQDRMARLFGDAYLRDEDTGFRGTWTPAVDIFETEHHDLVLKGSKKFEADVREENYRRVERSYGAFHRSFTLPITVDASKVSADYRNGVLTVRLPFREDAKPRTVNVDVAA